MKNILKEERKTTDLAKWHVVFLLVLVSIGSSIIYTPAYLRYTFYNQLLSGLQLDDKQVSVFISAYALTATICYLPSGILADKIRVRTLGWVGFCSTALLTYLYAFVPSISKGGNTTLAFQLLVFIHIAMGITTILIWWGIRFKLVRLISATEEQYSRDIGLSYAFYGMAGLLVGLMNAFILGIFADNGVGMQTLLIVLGTIILLLGILSFIFIPRFHGELDAESGGMNLSMVLAVAKMPVAWLAAGTLFFVYFVYTNMYWITPYFTDVMGADQKVTDVVSVLRTYGVTLLSAPVFGFIATKVKSPSKAIVGGAIGFTLVLASFGFIPADPSFIILFAVLQLLLAFLSNGAFGICSSQLSEGKVPLSVFGTATGLLSVIGFLPDTICPPWFATYVDAAKKTYEQTGDKADLMAGYHTIFWILTAGAFLAGLFAFLLRLYVVKNAKTLEAVFEEAEENSL